MTKYAMILAAAAAFGATSATAASTAYFNGTSAVEISDELDLGYVHSPAAGTVSVYEFGGDMQGKLLGTEEVMAGANNDLEVDVTVPTSNKVLVTLDVDGEVLAQKVVNINDM